MRTQFSGKNHWKKNIPIPRKQVLGFILAAFFQLFLMKNTFSQQIPDFRFYEFTSRDGFKGGILTNILEEKKGFIWIGSKVGIYKFDGVFFKNYQLPLQDSTRATNTNLIVQSIEFQNKIWCLNDNGEIYKLNTKKDSFEYIGLTLNSNILKKPLDKPLDFLADSVRNIIWMLDEIGLWQYNPEKKVKQLAVAVPFVSTSKLFFDTNNRIWSKLKTGILCFDPNNKNPIVFLKNQQIKNFGTLHSKVWVLSADSTFVFETNKPEPNIESQFLTPTNFKKISVGYFFPKLTGDSIFWGISLNDGFSLLHFKTGELLKDFSGKNSNNLPFEKNELYSIFQTKNNSIWYSSNKSLIKSDFSEYLVKTFTIEDFENNHFTRIRRAAINPINPAEMWVSTSKNGLFLIDKSSRKIKKSFFQKAEKVENAENWSAVQEFLTTPEREIWVCSVAGMAVIDPKNHLKKFPLPNDFGSFLPFSKEYFALCRRKEMSLFNRKTGENRPISIENLDKKLNFLYFNEGANHSFLISTEVGVYRIRLFEPIDFQSPKGWAELVFSSPNVADLVEDSTTISACVQQGIGIFDKKNHQLKVFGAAEGLTNTTIKSILNDAEGNLWMNSDDGIQVFFPKLARFKRIGIEDGLSDNIVRGVLSKNLNRFYAYFDYSFSELNPRIELHRISKKPIFLSFSALNKPISFDSDSLENTTFLINADQNVLRVEFTCLDFYQSQKITFEYQLSGFDAIPISNGKLRFVNYTNLDGGEYALKIWAINADGFRCPEPAILRFRVIPPFYKTWWFYVISMLVVIEIIAAIFQNRLKNRFEKEHIRQKIARDLHDDLGTTLTTISILSEAASRNQTTDFEKMQLNIIGDKSRQAMESMSDIVWAVNPANDSIQLIVERMGNFATETLETSGINVHFSTDFSLAKWSLPMAQRKEFYLLFKEAVTNCAKHSQAQNAFISWKKTSNNLVFELKDDGIGLPAKQKFQPNFGGNGLLNMAIRAENLHGQFSAENAPDGGTVVRLSMPYPA